METGKRWKGAGGRMTKGQEETFGDDEYVGCLDYGGFMGVYICQNLNCTL